MKKHKKLIIVAVSLVLAAALTVSAVIFIPKMTAKEAEVFPVTRIRDYARGDQFGSYGNIMAGNVQSVYPAAEMLIESIDVSPGDAVAVGDPLLSYDTSIQELNIRSIGIAVDILVNEISKADKDLARAKTLVPSEPLPPLPEPKNLILSGAELTPGTESELNAGSGGTLVFNLAYGASVSAEYLRSLYYVPDPAKTLNPANPYSPANPDPNKPFNPADPTQDPNPDPNKPFNPADPTQDPNPDPNKDLNPDPLKRLNPANGEAPNPDPDISLNPDPAVELNPDPTKPLNPAETGGTVNPDIALNPDPKKPLNPKPDVVLNPDPAKPLNPIIDGIDRNPVPGKDLNPDPTKPLNPIIDLIPRNPDPAKAPNPINPDIPRNPDPNLPLNPVNPDIPLNPDPNGTTRPELVKKAEFRVYYANNILMFKWTVDGNAFKGLDPASLPTGWNLSSGIKINEDLTVNTSAADRGFGEFTKIAGTVAYDTEEHYTQKEIDEMIKTAEDSIRNKKTELKGKRLELKQAEAAMGDGTVKSEVDGVVSEVNDPEALEEGQPLIVAQSDKGYRVEGSVSELNLGRISLGQSVTVNSWSTGGQYPAEITAIYDFPARYPSGSMGVENPLNSQYTFVAMVSAEETLTVGDWVEIAIEGGSGREPDDSVLYIPNAYIREESGASYVLKADENGILVKQYVATGKSNYGYSTEIKSGLTQEDMIAFPYGKTAREGAKTVVAEEGAMW